VATALATNPAYPLPSLFLEAAPMKRVTGIGGIFFKSQDPKQLYDWYQKHLGIEPEPHGQGSIPPIQKRRA
jgi:hypothetical protein